MTEGDMPKVNRWDDNLGTQFKSNYVCDDDERLAQLRWIREKLEDKDWFDLEEARKAIDKELEGK